jgi:hypothetical protein
MSAIPPIQNTRNTAPEELRRNRGSVRSAGSPRQFRPYCRMRRHPFTDPATAPYVIDFWTNSRKTTVGSIAMVAAAIKLPQSV